MNIVARGKAFVESLRKLAKRSAWDWRCCPKCGETDTCKHGSYNRNPWFLDGRREVHVQRHWCNRCKGTYSEGSALLIMGSWYAREVHRAAIDYWQFGGNSLRRAVQLLRAHLDHQGRWLIWRPLDPELPEGGHCHLGASTVHRWLDGAGKEAKRAIDKHLDGVPSSGQMGTDGLWAVLRGGGKRVVLALVDNVAGLIWPPVVVEGEDEKKHWGKLFERAKRAGLDQDVLRGIASDGAKGLVAYLNEALEWVNHQRCVFHVWRNLAGELAKAASEAALGLSGEAAKVARDQVRKELVSLIHGVVDAKNEAAAEVALAQLATHRLGAGLAAMLRRDIEKLLVYQIGYNEGLLRVAPEWVWRDFRLRLSRGRNHGSDVRLERAALVWAIYRNFTPAQWRCERKRKYRHPGQSPLEVAGVPPGKISYLDALAV
ncbi:MAG TPA: transposase [Anaerolineales bacterium]|nr:transposase [Anaerolineales bacterium]